MKKYGRDNLDTKKDHRIHSEIMETAHDLAEELALKEWGETRKGFWVEAEENEFTLSEEAQCIFNEYYDNIEDELYRVFNRCLAEHLKED
jgi:hypothetical protein